MPVSRAELELYISLAPMTSWLAALNTKHPSYHLLGELVAGTGPAKSPRQAAERVSTTT